jgi:hypothetical protein
MTLANFSRKIFEFKEFIGKIYQTKKLGGERDARTTLGGNASVHRSMETHRRPNVRITV